MAWKQIRRPSGVSTLALYLRAIFVTVDLCFPARVLSAEHILGEKVVLDEPAILGPVLRDDREIFVVQQRAALSRLSPVSYSERIGPGLHPWARTGPPVMPSCRLSVRRVREFLQDRGVLQAHGLGDLPGGEPVEVPGHHTALLEGQCGSGLAGPGAAARSVLPLQGDAPVHTRRRLTVRQALLGLLRHHLPQKARSATVRSQARGRCTDCRARISSTNALCTASSASGKVAP
ncbi:hypothetical protein OHA74_55390 [Streptomyces phaeochromogenes]|nr:hypothetical protein [Streptomyces phaeochromogenes]